VESSQDRPDGEQDPPYHVLGSILEAQCRMIEVGRELSWLVQRARSTPAAGRQELRAQFDEVAAVLSAYAEQIGTLVAEYRDGKRS
jgi:hypothetical protein